MSRNLVTEFLAAAARAPQATAVVDGADRISYAELSGRAARVAADLAAAGVSPGDLVGICLPRGGSVPVAVLGVLAAGCGYVPLDPGYPADRLAFMAADAGLAAVLVGPETSGLVDTAAAEVLIQPDAAPGGQLCPAADPDPDAPAYVIFTSGSTGRPKGVVVTHGNVLALFDGAARHFSFGPDDRWTLFHSYSFDFSVWELWGPLLYGGQLICVPDELAFDPAGLQRLLVDEQVTVLNMVPSVFRHLMAGPDGPPEGLALRYVVFGGEAVDPPSVRRWLDRLPAGRRPEVVNMYGITETTVHVTYRLMGEADLSRSGPGTLIGTALPHLAVQLLDRQLRPVPPGEPGEIVVFGAGVSGGYLNRPELNRERFPVLPGPDGRPARCFRSGDLAYLSPDDGSMVYLGRGDEQVQVHGFRIELGEIEETLRRSAAVADAAVAVARTADGAAALVGFVALADPSAAAAPALRALRAELRRSLPRHMVPGQLHVVAGLPRTASGKLDRKALLSQHGREDAA
jgi:amino acid adenylation domain-containing protein